MRIIPNLSDADVARFWKRVGKPNKNGCMLWKLRHAKMPHYGTFVVSGKQYYAHVISKFISTGIQPNGLIMRHTCDVHLCVNPEHLVPGTCKENSADVRERGTADKFGRIEFRLSEKLLNQIKRVAADRGVKLAEVLRAAVANEIKRSK